MLHAYAVPNHIVAHAKAEEQRTGGYGIVATTPEDYFAFLDRISGSSGNPKASFAEQMQKLDTIIETLRTNPLAHHMRIFGSSVTEKDKIPGDIDVYVDLREVSLEKSVRSQGLHDLLNLAVHGGYHGNLGLFDPFVQDAKGRLFCRNDGHTPLHVEWRLAEKGSKKAIVIAGQRGVSLERFERRFVEDFPVSDENSVVRYCR